MSKLEKRIHDAKNGLDNVLVGDYYNLHRDIGSFVINNTGIHRELTPAIMIITPIGSDRVNKITDNLFS